MNESPSLSAPTTAVSYNDRTAPFEGESGSLILSTVTKKLQRRSIGRTSVSETEDSAFEAQRCS